jgi:xanthine dehydrogenase YagT iron-sulfur-binding subunit
MPREPVNETPNGNGAKAATASSARPASGLSRRGFLKGAGVSAAGTVLLDTTLAQVAEAQAQAAEPKVMGPGAVPITLKVNGESKRLNVLPGTTLADALRVDLDLTGTKVVCDRGSCSACTVMLDGVTVCSCMTLALDVGNREVRTIEGLAKGEQLHPVQEQFIQHDGMQCGFCTPGMIMSCVHLLEKNPNPTLDDVRHATRGNLCRCGTYPKVYDATLAAAKQMGGRTAGARAGVDGNGHDRGNGSVNGNGKEARHG